MDYAALAAAVPLAIVWLVYSRRLNAAIDREIARAQVHAGQRVPLSSGFISRWTTLAVCWFGSSSAIGLALTVVSGAVDLPEGRAAVMVVLVYLLVVLVSGLSAGAIVQRHMRRPWFSADGGS